jgi:hypothetical protein
MTTESRTVGSAADMLQDPQKPSDVGRDILRQQRDGDPPPPDPDWDLLLDQYVADLSGAIEGDDSPSSIASPP